MDQVEDLMKEIVKREAASKFRFCCGLYRATTSAEFDNVMDLILNPFKEKLQTD